MGVNGMEVGQLRSRSSELGHWSHHFLIAILNMKKIEPSHYPQMLGHNGIFGIGMNRNFKSFFHSSDGDEWIAWMNSVNG